MSGEITVNYRVLGLLQLHNAYTSEKIPREFE